MIIQHNMQAMNANRMLGGIVTSQSKVTEKLSSGYRINRAGDDAAGLSISEKMRAQINGLNRASTNAQDAISLIQTAEGALTETHSILQRMRELSVQAATDTNVQEDREALQSEIEQLTSEINRIAKTTQFNGMNLLDGSKAANHVTGDAQYVENKYLLTGEYDVKSAAGVTQTGTNKLSIASGITLADSDDMNWTSVDPAGTNTVKLTNGANGIEVEIKGASNDLETIAITDKLEANEDGDYVYNEHGVSFTITAEEYAKWDASGVATLDVKAANNANTDGFSGAKTYSLDNDYTSGPKNLAINNLKVDTDTLADKYGDNVKIEIATSHTDAAKSETTIKLTAEDGTVLDEIKLTLNMESQGNVYKYDSHGLSFDLDVSTVVTDGAAAEAIEVTLDLAEKLGTETKKELASAEEVTDDSLYFQVGANASQIINVSLGDMSAAALGITSDTDDAEGFSSEESVASDGVSNDYDEYALDLTTRENANKAITKLDEAIKKVSEQRSALGAVQNRLEHTIANLDTSAENLQAAESRIRDVDMAEEMVEYSKNNILQQAAQSMLAQANQSTQGVLSLLQ